MMNVEKYGNFMLVEYKGGYFAIEFSNKSIGMIIKMFDNKTEAVNKFNSIVKTLTEKQAIIFSKKINALIQE